jgi:hypothetical protein
MHVQFDRSHGNGRRIYCRILQAGEAIALGGQASAAGMAGILTGGCDELSSTTFISGANIFYTRERLTSERTLY